MQFIYTSYVNEDSDAKIGPKSVKLLNLFDNYDGSVDKWMTEQLHTRRSIAPGDPFVFQMNLDS